MLHGALGLGPTDSPSLSFEEFLVFLYAFSELRYVCMYVCMYVCLCILYVCMYMYVCRFEGVVIYPAVLQQEQGDDDDTEVHTFIHTYIYTLVVIKIDGFISKPPISLYNRMDMTLPSTPTPTPIAIIVQAIVGLGRPTYGAPRPGLRNG